MTIKEYTDSCLKFAEASKGWEKLDENSFYTTFDKTWEMSGDNQNGGVGVEWAFHLAEDEIRAQAAEKFLAYIAQELDMPLNTVRTRISRANKLIMQMRLDQED